VAAVTEAQLTGTIVLKAADLLVVHGFIDPHAHGQTNESNEYQAHDGVTAALEIEVGVPAVGAFLRSCESTSMPTRINAGRRSRRRAPLGRLRVLAQGCGPVAGVGARLSVGSSARCDYAAISGR
jgi:hypothetical protein